MPARYAQLRAIRTAGRDQVLALKRDLEELFADAETAWPVTQQLCSFDSANEPAPRLVARVRGLRVDSRVTCAMRWQPAASLWICLSKTIAQVLKLRGSGSLNALIRQVRGPS